MCKYPQPTNPKQVVTVCAYCHKQKGRRGDWQNNRAPHAQKQTHGVCPKCYAVARARLLLELAEMKRHRMSTFSTI